MVLNLIFFVKVENLCISLINLYISSIFNAKIIKKQKLFYIIYATYTKTKNLNITLAIFFNDILGDTFIRMLGESRKM